MTVDLSFRSGVLEKLGAQGEVLEEMLAYSSRAFDVSSEDRAREYPLPDEESVAAWERYALEAADVGLFERLQQCLVQLNFPIAAGISESSTYQAATRRGEAPPIAEPGDGLSLADPEGLRLLIHPTPAGRVPVLIAAQRQDFESLLQALTRRNEPEPISPAVGATMIAGYNNWERVRDFKGAWKAENPFGLWAVGFNELIPQKHLYQDRFILLSSGRYSDVPAADLGLEEDEWIEQSIAIRREHECAHYFTRRVFGIMQNALHDEIVADYMGIVEVAEHFRADWFLHFMGLEDTPRFRTSGRLGTYRGDPALSDEAFEVLQSLVVAAASNLEAADRERRQRLDLKSKALTLCALCELSIEEIASSAGAERLARFFSQL